MGGSKQYGLRVIHKPSNTLRSEQWFNTESERNAAMGGSTLEPHYIYVVQEREIPADIPNELVPLREWLQEHGMELSSVSAEGDTSVTVEVLLPDGEGRKLHVPWELLRGFKHQEIKDYLESKGFAKDMLERDLYIARPTLPTGS
jgi:hypothetical protein